MCRPSVSMKELIVNFGGCVAFGSIFIYFYVRLIK